MSLPPLASFPPNGVAAVVGAGGGIGSAVADALDATGRFARVVRLGRRTLPPLELTDEASIRLAADHLASLDLQLRLVFDATGLLHGEGLTPEKSWRELDAAALARAFAVNAIGPGLLMKHVLPRLSCEGKAVFATLSARVGSIGDNRAGGWYAYRASKAALNQLVRTAAIELARRAPEAICVSLHPGTVDTALSRPFRKTGLDVRSPATTAADLLAVIDRLEPKHTGGFFDHRGEPAPW